MTNNEVQWLFEEANRELLLLSSCGEIEREKLLENIRNNVNELRRILLETKNGKTN